ncbi:MAG: hypothetical protein ACC657_05630 [Thiohalomonadales bacterium]
MINPIPDDEKIIIFPINGFRMLELGNKKNSKGVYKDYFNSIGIEHISIDWNGEDGALNLDLRKPIKLDPFTHVTNIGTTEHVTNQKAVWENIHNLTDIDGVISSLTPLPGDWWWHGTWYPTEEFFYQFQQNGYKIEYMAIGREHPNRNLCVRLRKVENCDFIMPDMNTFYINEWRPR